MVFTDLFLDVLDGFEWLFHTHAFGILTIVQAILYLGDSLIWMFSGNDGQFTYVVAQAHGFAEITVGGAYGKISDVYGSIAIGVLSLFSNFVILFPIVQRVFDVIDVIVTWTIARLAHPYILYVLFDCVFTPYLPAFSFVVNWALLRFVVQFVCRPSTTILGRLSQSINTKLISFTLTSGDDPYPNAMLVVTDTDIYDAISFLVMYCVREELYTITLLVANELREVQHTICVAGTYVMNFCISCFNSLDRYIFNPHGSRFARFLKRVLILLYRTIAFTDRLTEGIFMMYVHLIRHLRERAGERLFDIEAINA